MSLIAQTRKSSGRHTTFAIVALGSLSMTIAALTAWPQLVAWLGLGGATSGLDDLDPGAVAPGAPASRPRLVSRPMLVALLVEGLAAILSIARAT
jgi:hypothetical protein